jgi:hypothetical protein
MLSEAKARSFCGAPPAADPSEAPMNRWSPYFAGEGRRLLEGVSLPEKLQLKLVDSKIFKSGCVALRYLKQ